MTFEVLLVVSAMCCVAQVAILVTGLRKTKKVSSTSLPKVSVVIAARDEELHLADCLRSVTNQTYRKENLEIIIASDQSSDRTPDICREFEQRFDNLRWFDVVQDDKFRGKANALAQAIDKATGEIILITDADCEVPASWVENTASFYGTEIGLVGGITLQKASNAFEGIQSLDWAYVLGVGASMAARGNPLGSIGNNLSFRRKAYDEVGGYRGVKFSVTEDYSMIQSIVASRRWQYRFPLDPGILVMSQPCGSWKDLIRQKHRWGKGGLDMKLVGLLIMATTCTLILASFAMLLWNGVLPCVAGLLVKSVADYAFLYAVLTRLQQTKELRYFWWFEAYFTAYVLLLPLLVAFGGKVVWKGRTY
jgi:cellulose synthase/poly-beta-1,6-N-acetylglucosamine synthase-like glycosyltransferase